MASVRSSVTLLDADSAHPQLNITMPTPLPPLFSPHKSPNTNFLMPRYPAAQSLAVPIIGEPSGSLALRRRRYSSPGSPHQMEPTESLAEIYLRALEQSRPSDSSVFGDDEDEAEDYDSEMDIDEEASEASDAELEDGWSDDEAPEYSVDFADKEFDWDSAPTSPDSLDAQYTPLPRKPSLEAPYTPLRERKSDELQSFANLAVGASASSELCLTCAA